MKKNYVYLLFTNDKYELPTAVGETIKDLSCITGISISSLSNSYIRKGSCYHGKYRVIKVDIPKEEDDYEFDFTDYVRYCDLHNLKTNRFSSLEKFKKYVLI